ncbi:MAG: winged helix-turn-helix transcriptional regulator, partial [Candidatus Hodarchaeota archaeon]
GALAYYLRVLEREELIKSERDGMFKRFYPTKGKIIREVFELTNTQQDIYSTIKKNFGISQKNISDKLSLSQSTINYHIQLMVNARIIRIEREGKKTKCFIVEEIS